MQKRCRIRVGVHAPTKSVSVPATISYNPGLPYTHTDKIAIGACNAVSFVSDAEQSTWLPCGIGVFDVTTSKISSDGGASQKSCDVTA
jgi:hypothetical protein